MKVVIIALFAGTAGVVHRHQVDPRGEAAFSATLKRAAI